MSWEGRGMGLGEEGVLRSVTNKPNNRRAEGGDLRESTGRRPSICLAIPALPHRWA
jgi:hypothetical protein